MPESITGQRHIWLSFYRSDTVPWRFAGAILGGGQGAFSALRKPPDGVDSARLRLNRLLNMSGRAGRSSGNALGALGLFFSSFESGIGYLSEGSIPDSANSIAAGAVPVQFKCVLRRHQVEFGNACSEAGARQACLPTSHHTICLPVTCLRLLLFAGFATGALFRSARGLRSAGVAGAVGAVAATLLVAARSTLSKGL